MEVNVKNNYPFTRETKKSKWSPETAGGIAMACTMLKGLKASAESAQGYLEMFSALAALGGHAFPFLSLSRSHCETWFCNFISTRLLITYICGMTSVGFTRSSSGITVIAKTKHQYCRKCSQHQILHGRK